MDPIILFLHLNRNKNINKKKYKTNINNFKEYYLFLFNSFFSN